MGSIKYRNGMDLTETKDIKKRWQRYTEELHKKDLHNPNNHNGMITYLKPDILECLRKGISHIMKRALESIIMNKASGGDGILPGASTGDPTHDKVMWKRPDEQDRLGLERPPGPARASTPKPESVCLTILCLSPTLLTLTGGYP